MCIDLRSMTSRSYF